MAPDSLPALSRLSAAWPYLAVFVTLFRGGDEEVLMRLLVLRELGNRADAPYWTPQDIAQRFAYLNDTKLGTILGRLREGELLVYDSDAGHYALSEGARVALAALATLIDFAGDDVELGYLTSQVAAGQSVGQVSDEAMQHLLARLNELHAEFADALESQSEFRIRAAQHRLESVWRWVGRSTDVVRSLTADDTLSLATLKQAQAIALAQSRMLALAGTFERRLAQLAAQRVHLGSSGLTSTDIADWLRHLGSATLAGLLDGALRYGVEPAFLTTPSWATWPSSNCWAAKGWPPPIMRCRRRRVPKTPTRPRWNACWKPKRCTTPCCSWGWTRSRPATASPLPTRYWPTATTKPPTACRCCRYWATRKAAATRAWWPRWPACRCNWPAATPSSPPITPKSPRCPMRG